MENLSQNNFDPEVALKEFEERKVANAKKPRIDNSSLYAGSPMYYYCRACGGLSDVLAESDFSSPKRYCKDCQKLIDQGILKKQ